MGVLLSWEMRRRLIPIQGRQRLSFLELVIGLNHLQLALRLHCQFGDDLEESQRKLNPGVRATQPVLGIADTERDPIEDNDCVSDLSADVLTPESYSIYGYRVASIIANTTSGQDAVHELKSLGSEVFCPKET